MREIELPQFLQLPDLDPGALFVDLPDQLRAVDARVIPLEPEVQSQAVRPATKWVLYRNDERWYVYEVVQPVKLTPLGDERDS